jgi:hypothetical protein
MNFVEKSYFEIIKPTDKLQFATTFLETGFQSSGVFFFYSQRNYFSTFFAASYSYLIRIPEPQFKAIRILINF